MAKLYPPNINGTIPAFYGTVLTVPFSMNKAVSKNEICGFALKIKTVNGTVKGVIKTTDSSKSSYDVLSEMEASFDLTGITFEVGQFYKVQLAYIKAEDKSVGYYSSVGVTKYTTQPTISIAGLQFGRINSHNYYYTGSYSQKGGDTTEKLYSSRFRVYDENKDVIEDTGDVLHNTSEDDLSYEAHEDFQLPQDLEIDKSYYIRFSVLTVNNLSVSTPYYRIMQRRSVSPEINAELVATLDYDDGYVNLTINDTEDDVISGTFLISRGSSLNGYAWEEFRRFDLQSMIPDKWSMLDCTVEQGATYRYSLQQYNANGVYSDRIISNDIYADFEDAFLYDGERQLNIRFNPKVSTFKNDILETKTDTIGSQHPYITRNGNVNYKEFAISGLISYQMDNVELFMTKEDLGITQNITDLISENITAERLFKNEVLTWLTNGKPKIFRSPTEGNYIVRLMNVTMSPNDVVGRMLHSFNCSAYEIASFTTENLEYYGLIDPSENLVTQTRWATIKLSDYNDSAAGAIRLVDTYVYSVFFSEMTPGSYVYVNDETIIIGATGSYYFESTVPITYVGVQKIDNVNLPGLLTYSYKTKAINVFGTITDVSIIDVPLQQFIGDSYKQRPLVFEDGSLYTSDNLLEVITDSKTEVLSTCFMRFWKRDIQYVYINATKKGNPTIDPNGSYTYFKDMNCSTIMSTLDKWPIYMIRYKRDPSNALDIQNEGYYIDANSTTFAPFTGYAIDGMTGKIFEVNYATFQILFNNSEKVDISETEKYYLPDTSSITSVSIGPGVIAELSYSKQSIEYSFETEKVAVVKAKTVYSALLEEYLDHCDQGTNTDAEEDALNQAYREFIIALNKAITAYKEANGIIS